MLKETKNIVTTAVVFMALATLFGYFVYSKNEEVTNLEEDNQKLISDISLLKSKAEQRDKQSRTLEELQNAVKEYVKILPNPQIATEEKVITVFSDYQTRSGIKLRELVKGSERRLRQPKKKSKGKKSDDFEEIEVRLKVEGTYQQFVNFLNFVERHESFLQVRSFSLANAPKEVGDSLNANVTVSTFRYNASK